MSSLIEYNSSLIAGTSTVTTIPFASETELLVITDRKFAAKSQVTIYFDITLGSATEVTFRYYVRPRDSAVWYQLPQKDPITGILTPFPTVLDSTSPTVGSDIRTVEDLNMSGCYALRITGQATTADADLNSLDVLVRDN